LFGLYTQTGLQWNKQYGTFKSEIVCSSVVQVSDLFFFELVQEAGRAERAKNGFEYP